MKASERGTDLGGAPTEWNRARDLAEHLRLRIQHGNDPTPHLARFRELLAGPTSSPDCRQFLDLVERYLSAIRSGSIFSQDLKHEVEQFRFVNEGSSPPSA